MVIVDTSVWVDSMRARDDQLGGWMTSDLVLQHPFVTAEIGMGSFRSAGERARMIDLLDSFEQIRIADVRAFHAFVAENALYGTGIGFADAHLLLACVRDPAAQLATRDRRLARQGERLGIEIID